MPLLDDVRAVLAGISDGWDATASETDALDFKQTPDSAGDKDRRAPERFVKDLAESVVCFSNGPREGALVIGVRNKAAARVDAIPGVDPARWDINDLVAKWSGRTSPCAWRCGASPA